MNVLIYVAAALVLASTMLAFNREHDEGDRMPWQGIVLFSAVWPLTILLVVIVSGLERRYER